MPYSYNIPKKEVARLVGVSESTIVCWVKAKTFPQPFAVGGRTSFHRPEIDKWLANKRETERFSEGIFKIRRP